MGDRSPAEIRASVEDTRRELQYSLNDLQSKVSQLTDWRSQLAQHTDAYAHPVFAKVEDRPGVL